MVSEYPVMRWRICYAGINPDGLSALLGCSRLMIVGAARLRFLQAFTLNPVNWLFQLIYLLRMRGGFTLLEVILIRLLTPVGGLLTGHWKRYHTHLLDLCKHRIPIVVIDDRPGSISTLRRLHAELLVLNIWEVVSKGVLTCFSRGAINIHPSKLPKYRGALPTLWSIRNKDSESAVSFVIADCRIDRGNILLQVPFEISDEDDWRNIEKNVDGIVRKHLEALICGFLSGQVAATEQQSEGASVTAKYDDYRRIDLANESTREIANKVAYYPYWDAGVFCFVEMAERIVPVKRVKVVHDAPPPHR